MRLKSLSIRLQEFGVKTGKYAGEIEFTNQWGKVEILLDEAVSETILRICADALVSQAKKSAELIAGNILEAAPSVPQLEAQ